MVSRKHVVSLLAALLGAVPAAAQTVRGTLHDPSGAPAERVLVALVSTTGGQVARTLTGADGGFTLRAPAAGRYSLRAERIGYAAVTAGPFDLAAGETRTERLTASGAAVTLQGLTVTPESRRCQVRPEAGLATATLWEEARKALNATALGQSERMFRYDLNQWTREIDPADNTVRHEERRTATGTADLPFRSLSAGELSRRGYVQAEAGDSMGYWAPDAAVMLSGEFLTDHCLRVVEGSDPRLIGLAFEPVRERRVADIRGTLWLDRKSAELRRVEYGYQGGPPGSDDPRVGGTVEYERLAGGPWIVRRWTIRMPQLSLERQLHNVSIDLRGIRTAASTPEARLSALLEAGGEVASVRGADGRPLFAATARPFVRGVVWDSTRAAPLAGAQVYLSGTQAGATAGPDGAFVLQAPGEGRYTVAFSHPELGPLAAAAGTRTVVLHPGDTATVALAVPGWAAARRALCAGLPAGSFQGIVYGRVTGPGADQATVTGSWSGAPASPSRGSVAARPDAQGFYVLCGVATQARVTVRAQASTLRGQAEVRAGDGAPVRADLEVAPAADAPRMADAAPAGRTMAVLTRDAAGAPLGGATVRIGSLPAVRTDAGGHGRVALLAPGEYPVTLAHPALGELRGRITVGADAGGVEIRPEGEPAARRLAATVSRAVALAGVEARAEQRSRTLEIVGFYARRARGMGVFLGDSALQARPADRVTDVLRRVDGVRVLRLQEVNNPNLLLATEWRIASARNSTGISRAGPCWMDVYVDGQPAQTHDHPELGRNLDQMAIHDVQGMEVYRSAGEVPVEYRTTESGCGVVLLWTRR